MAVHARPAQTGRPSACRQIGERLGINPETLRGSVIQAEIDEGDRLGVTTADHLSISGEEGLACLPATRRLRLYPDTGKWITS